MKLNVIVEEKRGVISITSEQFIIEELKAHICQKMGLEHSEYKTKVVCGSNPSLELIRNPTLSFNDTKKQSFLDYSNAKIIIFDMLREEWKNVEIETFEDITANAKRLSKSEQKKFNISKYEKVSYFDFQYPFFLAIKSSEVYLIIARKEDGKTLSIVTDISIVNLFNIKTASYAHGKPKKVYG
jgi:hypothetical protein